MLSIWEKESFLHADMIIVGGGILGLSTACSLLERNNKKSVLVLEQGLLPTGASTKNAGFACFGSLSELVSDLKSLGESLTVQLVEKRWQGLALLDQRLGEGTMDFQHHGGFELMTEKEAGVRDYIGFVNDLLFPLFQMEVFYSTPSKISQFGFNPEIVKDVIFNPFEGQIDSGKMMRALHRKALSLGAEIMTGAEVVAVHTAQHGVEIEVQSNKERLIFSASSAAVCTNAFLPILFPTMEVKAGRGQVVVTKPIEGLKLKGVFHFDEGFYYFRNFNDRVIFGGGRNLDMKGEATIEFAPNEKILSDLKEKLDTIILPDTPYEIDYSWQGIMGFGPTKLPLIESPAPHIYAALGCNGMGLALSSLLGEELAEKILS